MALLKRKKITVKAHKRTTYVKYTPKKRKK